MRFAHDFRLTLAAFKWKERYKFHYLFINWKILNHPYIIMIIATTKIGQINQWLEYSMRSFGLSASSFNTFVFSEEVTEDFGRDRVTPQVSCCMALLASNIGSLASFFECSWARLLDIMSWSKPFEATSGKIRFRNVNSSSSSP